MQVWEFLGFKQARSLSVAPMTPRQPDLRLCQFYSHCSREGQYFPQERPCCSHRPGSLPALALPGMALLPYALRSGAKGHPILKQGALDREHRSSFIPSLRSNRKFPQLFLPPLLGQIHLKHLILAPGSPLPGSLS